MTTRADDNDLAAASALVKSGDYSSAEIILRQLVERYPEHIGLCERLMEVLCKQGEYEGALLIFQHLLPFLPGERDDAFEGIYVEALRATGTCPIPLGRLKRFRALGQLFAETRVAAGDIAECGCYRGMSSYLLCSLAQRLDPSFHGQGYHIFDSFQGLSEPTEEDTIPPGHERASALRSMSNRGAFAASLAEVRENLSAFPGIKFNPGWIPMSFAGQAERRYRFVHVDVDLFDPTLDSLEYFYPRLVRGGMIVSDDYGWPGARQAIDDYCQLHAVACVSNEFNQAVIRKN